MYLLQMCSSLLYFFNGSRIHEVYFTKFKCIWCAFGGSSSPNYSMTSEYLQFYSRERLGSVGRQITPCLSCTTQFHSKGFCIFIALSRCLHYKIGFKSTRGFVSQSLRYSRRLHYVVLNVLKYYILRTF